MRATAADQAHTIFSATLIKAKAYSPTPSISDAKQTHGRDDAADHCMKQSPSSDAEGSMALGGARAVMTCDSIKRCPPVSRPGWCGPGSLVVGGGIGIARTCPRAFKFVTVM